MLGALRVQEADVPELVLLVKLQPNVLQSLFFRHGLKLFFKLLQLFGRRRYTALKVAAHGKELELGQQLGDLFIADALVHLVEKRQVIVKGSHERGQLRSFEPCGTVAITDGHAVGGAFDHDLDELAVILDVLLELALLDA